MTPSSEQATTFYREVAHSGKLWTVKDAKGFPAPKNQDGVRAMPFWSSLDKVNRVISESSHTKGLNLMRWIGKLSLHDGFLE